MTNSSVPAVESEANQLPEMFRKYRSSINEAMRNALTQDSSQVYDMLRYYLGWVDEEGNPTVATEGKFLRPTLCLFACEASGGSIRQAMSAAVALELIHNFSLIHDDIQDHDETRHHRKTLWAVWGMPKALVAGNVLRVIADASLEGLLREGVEATRALAVVRQLTHAYLAMIEGQYLDLSYEGRSEVGMPQYLDMIARKTGALIRCAFTMGALIGSNSDEYIEAFRESGSSLGFLFQIRDDILGVWGEEENTGKPVGADIIRKKNSFPVVYAMSASEGDDLRQLRDIYSKEKVSESDASTVLTKMDSLQTRGHARALAVEHCDRARDALAGIEMSADARTQIDELLRFLLDREH
ncbi:MAG: polyprenyl synthetase family protein [Chloroflexi bacterium]|nr:polyprenyl synthetase family protein [Chloroflexota bacterium]